MSITLEPKQSLEILKVIAEKNERIKQLEEYIEKLENEIKGYIGQHDSTDQ